MKLLILDIRKPNESIFSDGKDFILSKASTTHHRGYQDTGYLALWLKMLYYENSQCNLNESLPVKDSTSSHEDGATVNTLVL